LNAQGGGILTPKCRRRGTRIFAERGAVCYISKVSTATPNLIGFPTPTGSLMTNSAVLVLNRHYQPIHVTSAKRAFSLLYAGVARVIDPEFKTFDFESWAQLSAEVAGDDVIQTVSRAIRVPRVIVLQLYDRIPKTKVRFSRHNIYMRDGNTCQYCGQELPRSDLNLDHVVPRAQGGRTTWENVVCCCIDCNLTKAARTPDQAGMKLLKTPLRPRWTPTFRTNGGKIRYREWLPFLGVADASYWNVELKDD
jgi:5-methylcytosine-specific restriction endonuclease McrA